MQVILLEKVHNLGVLGDIVEVKPGFARNFLIPKGKAIAATAASKADFEARRAELEAQQTAAVNAAQARATALEGMTITVKRKAGEEGRLFGSVGAADVAEALTGAGGEVERSEVRMGDAIRQLGEYPVQLQLHPDVTAAITLVVEAEE
jgi:large subunit ribosomal protein L9